MFIRTLVLSSALCGGLAAAQFPTYSQQYLQRLGGAVDALGMVVADFDSSAAALGLTRDAALQQMQGTPFIEARRTDMQQTFERYERLSADLATLEGHGPFMRAYHLSHLSDHEVASGAWEVFEPALPLTFASALFALFGFGVTAAASSVLFALVFWRKRRPTLTA